MSSPPPLSPALRESTLRRFAEHRRTWDNNPALRACYAHWYHQVREALPSPDLGEWIELGSGPGFAAEFIPDLVLTDIVQAPWHVRQVAAESLPFADGEVGALVLFDVLHHVGEPAEFFAEATRVLRPGGGPIPGLYAAGEAAGFGGGGMHGYRSLEGTFLGGCLFSGRNAGRAAAKAVG